MFFALKVGENVGWNCQLDPIAMLYLQKAEVNVDASLRVLLDDGLRVIDIKVVVDIVDVEVNVMVLGCVVIFRRRK